jgi:tetratricopeptide (TPR) repeat protein
MKLILAYIFFLAAVVPTGGKSSSVNDDPLARRPPGRMAVSILWFENRAGEDAEHWRYGLKGSMNKAIEQVEAIRLHGGTGYARRKLAIEKGSALNAEAARKIGEIVEAQRVVWGSYQGSSNSWQVTALLLNVASGEVSEPITAVGTDWFDIRNTLIQQILEQLRINPSEEEKEKMLRRETHSLQALEWRVKSYAYQAKGRPLSIQEDASRQAIAADAQYAEAYVDLSAVLASQGKLDEAEISLGRAVEIKPDLASAHQVLGAIHLFKAQDKQALRELQEALRLDPENTQTLVRLSEFHATKKQWEQAVTYAEEAIALAPLDASMHAHLGLIYVNRHKREQAMRELREAERLADPDASDDLNTAQKIGQSYRLLGEIPLAVEYYERLVAQARTTGANPEIVGQFDKTLQRMKATLIPTFVEAEMPEVYTEKTLQEALRKNLAPAELDMVVNPVAGNPEISCWARRLTAGTTNEIDKARAIFDELIRRIQSNGGHGKRTAREVFADWDDPDQAFSCQEFAKLYLALAREVGLETFYVHLGRDYRGKLVFHDCAIIFVDGKALLLHIPAVCLNALRIRNTSTARHVFMVSTECTTRVLQRISKIHIPLL